MACARLQPATKSNSKPPGDLDVKKAGDLIDHYLL